MLVTTMLLDASLVTMLGQASMMLLVVSMSFLLNEVNWGGSVLWLGLGGNSGILLLGLSKVAVDIDSTDFLSTVSEFHLAICLMDKSIELVGLDLMLILDFLLLLNFQLGLESSILLLHLLNLAGCSSFLIIRLLNKLLVSLVMLLGVLVTMLGLLRGVHVNTTDFGSIIIDKVFLSISSMYKAIELIGIGQALFILLLLFLRKSSSSLGLLLFFNYGLLSLEGSLSLCFLLLSGLLITRFLSSHVSHACMTVSVLLMVFALSKSLR